MGEKVRAGRCLGEKERGWYLVLHAYMCVVFVCMREKRDDGWRVVSCR